MHVPAVLAIVEDDPAVRESLEALLRSSGYATQGYASGEDLLRSWSAGRFDCVLLDIDLPGITGWQILERIRSNPSSTPVVVVTGSTSRRDRETSSCLDACYFLRKPFSDSTLIETIERGLGSRPRNRPS